MTTPASRAADCTIPRSLWCSSIRKPEVEAAGQHACGLPIEDRVARQTTGEDLDRGLHVDAWCLEEDDRLRDELDRAGDDELIGRLNGLARAAAGRCRIGNSVNRIEQLTSNRAMDTPFRLMRLPCGHPHHPGLASLWP